MMSASRLLLHLSLIPGVGPVLAKKIGTQSVMADPDFLYLCCTQDLMNLFGCTAVQAQLLVHGLADRKLLDEELELIAKHAIQIATWQDKEYPQLLKQIHAPPLVLYIKGRALNDADNRLAIVGSRQAHAYSERTLAMLLPDLIKNEWVVVSGGALGADSYAHAKTLSYGGCTIAVLGSGLLRPYPRSNIKLFESILEHNGTMVSIFPLMQEPLAHNFPARNRVIAGISKGVLVLQAAEQSGALITAAYGLEQGREIFAVPGPILDPLSVGPHRLIQQGAHLVACTQDILEGFGCSYKTVSASYQQDLLPFNELSEQPKTIDEIVLQYCAKPVSFDDLIVFSKLSQGQLHTLLFDLQLAGKIEQNFAGLWCSV